MTLALCDGDPQSALAQFADQIRNASVHERPLCIHGGSSKAWYGRATTGDALDTRLYRGIIDYDPSELVITARAGTPLTVIEQALAERGQMLPFEPPHFGGGATFGGCVAAGLSGPRRATAGAVRDFVLGVVLMNGLGQSLHFGGQVVKNVAGYDVSRLMAGAMGTLGLLLDISVRTLPRPALEQTVMLEMSRDEALRELNEWLGRALPVTGSAWYQGQLHVRLGGARSAVQSAMAQLGGTVLEDGRDGAQESTRERAPNDPATPLGAIRFWENMRDQAHDFFLSRPAHQALWRVALPPTATSLTLPGEGDELIEWGGGQRWYRSDADPARIRAEAIALGGHATLYEAAATPGGSAADAATGEPEEIFTRPSAPLMAIHHRLKETFDPARIFNRGRLYPDL